MQKYFGIAKKLLDKGLAREGFSYDANNTYDDAITFTDDIEFYVSLSKKQGGKVLDIGCGTGRVMLPLMRAGIDVIGMDLSPHMLVKAKAKLGMAGFTPEVYEGDMKDFALPYEFSLIIVPYYSMIYMHSDDDRSSVLRCCFKHLKLGGVLAFDFDAGCGTPGMGKPWLGFEKIDESTGAVIIQTCQMNQVTEYLRIINILTHILKGPESHITVSASIEASIPTNHMKIMMQKAGFTVQGFYKDYDYTPHMGGEECVVVAAKLGRE